MKKIIILLLIVNSSLSFAQRMIPTTILNGVLHNHLYLNLDNYRIDKMSPLELHDLPLKIISLIVQNNILEIKGMSCVSFNPRCIPIGELRIFFARKNSYGYLRDTITLYHKINFYPDNPDDTTSIQYNDFYNNPFRICIDLNKGGFLYFYSEGCEINEIDINKLRKKMKIKLYKK